ncbi:MAG: TrbG/VirB9 family P-type conjugative transfer protein [Alphaproteobacteria bacterium]|nr:TrbG/VirB9 family P-type conjugative transfer protein [Alphaproteobacteria bacterium]MDY4689097.1 TrbG/VirB9 family P-type conjugative transfer protein [Alphaproteobacteria bacterium]
MKNLAKWTVLISLLFGAEAFAADLLENTDSLDQYADQSQGNYQPMNLNYAGFNSIGMIQSAWQDPLQNLGEGQTKPAYSKYYWTPDLVLPIRVREGMITLVNFPEWEWVESIAFGDTGSFDGSISEPNTVMLYPRSGSQVGVDSNVVINGRSGNKYVFYIKSEAVNTERLTNSIIDIDVVGGNGSSGGSPSSSSGVLKGGSAPASAFRDNKTVDATYTRRFLKEDWLRSLPIDPAKFRFDIEIYVPNPDDVVIAPERVWRDDIFTYIDLGEKALNMTQRPIVTLIVERVETPVGFRTKGPNNRLIIVEGIGDMVMRSGKRMVCLKLRRSDEEGLQYVSYADDQNSWDIAPKIPGGQAAGSGASGGAGGANGASGGDNAGGSAGAAVGTGGVSGSGVAAGGSLNGMMSVPNYANMPDGASGEAGASAGSGSGIMSGADCLPPMVNCGSMGGVQNPYPKYKYGSAFAGQKGENLSIELGTDSDVNNLENLWKDLSGRYSSLLGGYEPFYSVDAPADGQGKELFHLRVGPVKSLESGDTVCSQLGRSGVFCSVVRVQ